MDSTKYTINILFQSIIWFFLGNLEIDSQKPISSIFIHDVFCTITARNLGQNVQIAWALLWELRIDFVVSNYIFSSSLGHVLLLNHSSLSPPFLKIYHMIYFISKPLNS